MFFYGVTVCIHICVYHIKHHFSPECTTSIHKNHIFVQARCGEQKALCGRVMHFLEMWYSVLLFQEAKEPVSFVLLNALAIHR